MEKIREQIEWYEENTSSKASRVIKADLELIDSLYGAIENSEDRILLDKIIGSFCEIIELQRDAAFAQPSKVSADDIPWDPESVYDAPEGGFKNDRQLQEVFSSYYIRNGKSSYTVNDYCSRIKNLWKLFYTDYINGELPCELYVNEEQIAQDTPLLNAYNHTEALNCYVAMKITESDGNRNWANTRAAFNKFEEFKLLVEEIN